MKTIRKIIILLLIFILTIYVFEYFDIREIVLKKQYPIEYKKYVEKYSKEYSIDPFLIYSIIKAESNFNKDDISVTGAIGLMQIMEDTAYEVAQKANIEINNKQQLHDPKVNINIGIAYFANLLKIYDNNLNLSIIAYNAGMGNVNKWVKQKVINDDGTDIENIPFKETKIYTQKILKNYENYKKIYNDN